jgi:hypothetical protein
MDKEDNQDHLDNKINLDNKVNKVGNKDMIMKIIINKDLLENKANNMDSKDKWGYWKDKDNKMIALLRKFY